MDDMNESTNYSYRSEEDPGSASVRKRYSTTTDNARSPNSPTPNNTTTTNNNTNGFLPPGRFPYHLPPTSTSSPTTLSSSSFDHNTSTDINDDVFIDEKLKENNNDLPHFAPPPRTPGTAPAPEAMWAQRQCRTRHCVIGALVIVSVILVAVGVGLAIVLTNNVSQPSKASPSISSTTEAPVITYSGNFLLDAPWPGSKEQLQDSLSRDFISIVNESSLQYHYQDTRLESYGSPESTQVNFVLNFDPEVTSLIQHASRDPMREFIQTELRQLIPQRKTTLGIIPSTLTLIEYIPVTSSPSTSSSTSSSSSSSTSSTSSSTSTSTSTSTTPSTTTSTVSSTTPSTTTESTTESETTESTPSSTTESTTSESTTSSTTTESTTSSTTETATTETATTSSTPTVPSSTTSTEPSTTTEALPADCLPLDFFPCLGLGYTHFSLPNLLGAETTTEAAENFHYLANASLASGCTNDPTLFCGFAFPPCSALAVMTLPCYDSCQVTVDQCIDHLPFPLDCEGFPAEQPCLQSPFPPPLTTTPAPDVCTPITFERCRNLGFAETLFPTWFAENETTSVTVFQQWALPGVTSGCHPDMEFFMCAAFFPVCREQHGNVTLPCRSLCQDVEERCHGKGDILNLDCAMFQTDQSQCLLPPPPSTTTPTTTTTMTTPTTTTGVPTLPPEQCLPVTIETCRHFGHVNGTVPNKWGSYDASSTLTFYYDYVQPVVSTGCTPVALFYACAVLFPNCDDGVYLVPCRSVCLEYNNKCATASGFFTQDCTIFPTKEEDQYCLLPPSPKVCSEDEFSCEGIPKCIPKTSMCDRQDDCGDWSDERKCECNAEFEFQCTMGFCIRNYRRCDNNTDCPDGSDELGCSHCSNNQFQCDDGTCIMAEWRCDGQYDCPRIDYDDYREEDEENCSSCKMYEEFSCTSSGECLPLNQRCDGTPQCKDHTDENSCIVKGPPVFVNVESNVLPICAEGFSTDLAHTTCQRLGFSGAIIWNQMQYEFYEFFKPAANGAFKTVIGPGTIVDQCDKVIEVECAPAACGNRALTTHIITDGLDAEAREVPWQASIQEFGKHFCGGSLIHPSFVLTAAHCVEKYSMSFDYLEVVLGAVNFSRPETGRRVIKVKRIINHPQYMTFQGNDVALVELASPVTYSDDIQPLCTRHPGDVFSRASLCYTSGWGKTNPDSHEMATHLQIVKMTMWDTNKCNSSFAWDGQLQSTEICAGYYAGRKAACRGDSGGPLFCYDNDHRWTLVGVASYVHVGCNKPEKPVVYSDAVRYNDWIANNTVCQFNCTNGGCLYDKDMICNKVDDCGDYSDEVDQCDVSANCTFDDPYLCGYRASNGWLLVSESLQPNRYPLYDHSVGRYPGTFLLAAFRGKTLYSPRIDLTAQHCLRFRYHMRGKILQGLAAHAHELSTSGKWKMVWRVDQIDGGPDGPDRWLLGQFDLVAGNYDVVFTAYDNGVATVDDIELLPGKCQDQGCAEGEFSCNTSGKWNCLANALKCNTVVDCDDASDEAGCTDASYKCDFENGLLCGLQQDSQDSTRGEWRLVNASRAGINDVTFGDGAVTGNMLQMVTEQLLETDFVYMSHDLHLGQQEHCLAFSYFSTSTVRFSINFIAKVGGKYESSVRELWTIENRQTYGWTRTQTSLPAVEGGYLYYEVVGRDLNRSVLHPMVALDDITVTRGACPVLTCPDGHTLCATEPYCLDNSRLCDRHVDCLDAADEIECVCTAEEYRCPKGPCISLDRTCNTVHDCADASDEGTLCDSKRSVTCDFEHQFMCGYTHNGSAGVNAPYVWSREHSTQAQREINVGTGPTYDHTFKNQTGHWAFANGENGHPFDYVALESSPFSSGGNQVMVFYYYAYSAFSKFWLTGTLGVLIRDRATGSETSPWFQTVDGNATWRSACVALPKGDNLTVSFVAMRGEARRADLALDDVEVLDISCDQFFTDSRLQVGAATDRPVPTTPVSTGCLPGFKACRNGFCITETSFCDGISDCVDNSDEMECDNN